MTGRFGLRREAEALATALDGPSRDADSVTDAARLLETVDVLTRVPAPRMDPSFSAMLRERLLAEADELLATTATEERLRLPVPAPRAHRRRVAGVAAALVIVGSTAGVAAAAQSAAPGDALYGVKRGLERVQTDLTPGDVRRGNAYLDQATDRLAETRRLLGSGSARSVDARDSALIDQTLDAFTSSVQQGSELVLRGFQRHPGSRDGVVHLRSFAAQSLSDLAAMRDRAPAGVGEAFARAADAVAGADQRAVSLCQTCGGSPLTLPASLIEAGPPGAFERLLATPAAALPVLPVSTIGGDKQAIAVEADKADKAAKDAPPASKPASPSTPGSNAPAPAPTTPSTPGAGPSAATPAEQLLKSLTTDTLHTTQTITTPLLATVKGATNGLGQLTGGLTTPLTDPVNGLLGDLTGQQ